MARDGDGGSIFWFDTGMTATFDASLPAAGCAPSAVISATAAPIERTACAIFRLVPVTVTLRRIERRVPYLLRSRRRSWGCCGRHRHRR